MRNVLRLALLSVVALAASVTSGGSGVLAQGSVGKTYVITMSNMQFGGIPASAKVGDTIIWNNNDSVEHSATARDGSFDYRLKPGQKARTILKKAGTLRVDCIFHPTMRGVIKIAR